MSWVLLVAALAAAPMGAKQESGPVKALNIPDVELFGQDGKKVRFYSDLVKGNTVAVNFVFTTCSTICSPMTATFSRLQKELGEKSEVKLISITLDPRTDTPARLKAYAEKFERKPGWTFVTGDANRVAALLKALGGYVDQKETHAPMVLLGNDSKKNWRRLYGMQGPRAIAAELKKVAAGGER